MRKIMDLSLHNPDKDFTKVVARSRGIAGGMSKGVQFLMKKNKIDVIDGYGNLKTWQKSGCGRNRIQC